MAASPVRLVALDIDGTLIDDVQRMAPRTEAAVRDIVAAGVPVVLATGRIASSALPYAHRLGLTQPLIAMHGALLRAMPAPEAAGVGRLLDHRTLPAPVALEIIAWARARGLVPHVNYLERMLVARDDPWADEYATYEYGRVVLVPDLAVSVPRTVTKVVGVAVPPAAQAALADARAAFAGRADVTVSHPLFLEFVAPGVSKGAALRRLARRLGIDLRDVLAAGDQLNDLEMIEAVGWGVAMAHAPAELRAAARIVAPPVDEDGLGRVLEDYVLGRRAGRPAGRRRIGDNAGGAIPGPRLGRP